MYDTAHLRWSTEILDAVGLPHSLVPDVGGSAEVLGTVTVEAAGLTGLQRRNAGRRRRRGQCVRRRGRGCGRSG